MIGVPGVQAWGTTLAALHHAGVSSKRVLWAFDQDRPPNPTVTRAMRHGRGALAQAFSGVR